MFIFTIFQMKNAPKNLLKKIYKKFVVRSTKRSNFLSTPEIETEIFMPLHQQCTFQYVRRLKIYILT